MSSATSALYDEIYERGNWRAEVKLDVYPPDSNTLFYSFGEDRLIEVTTTRGLMPDGGLSVGNVIVGEIDVWLYPTDANGDFLSLPKNAKLKPYFRLVDTVTGDISEWVQKGVFNIESRKYNRDNGKMEIRGFDPLRKLEVGINWDETTNDNNDLLDLMSDIMGIGIDSRTFSAVDPDGTLDLVPINAETAEASQDELSARYVLECLCGTIFANAFVTNSGELLVLQLKTSQTDQVNVSGLDEIDRGEKQIITGVNASFNAFGSGDSVFFGTNDGVVFNVSCPYIYLLGTDFTDLLTDYSRWSNEPHFSTGAQINPAADLGDWFFDPLPPGPLGRKERKIHRQTQYFGTLMKSDVSSPHSEISEYETNYQGQQNGGSVYQTQIDRDMAARPTIDTIDNIVCGACEAIPSNADLNDYTKPGIYAANSSVASTLLNCPSTSGGRLTVISALGRKYTDASTNIYLRQIYEVHTGRVYQRRGTSTTGLSGVTWQDWKLVYGVDAVTDQATNTTSGWSYRVWANGKCELWFTGTVVPSSSTATSTSNGYYSNTISLPQLPFAISNATINGSANRKCWFVDPSLNSAGTTVSFILMRFTAVPTTSSQSVTVHVCVNADLATS